MRKVSDKKVCPVCGNDYYDYPALSRLDNYTEICPECGVIQALEVEGADNETINKILIAINEMSDESDR